MRQNLGSGEAGDEIPRFVQHSLLLPGSMSDFSAQIFVLWTTRRLRHFYANRFRSAGNPRCKRATAQVSVSFKNRRGQGGERARGVSHVIIVRVGDFIDVVGGRGGDG